jgi:hypothetical protein
MTVVINDVGLVLWNTGGGFFGVGSCTQCCNMPAATGSDSSTVGSTYGTATDT